jgi:AraC-like DNA-binding protein
MVGAVSGESIVAWKPPIAGLREVLHARFTTHAYPLHTHDTWTLFIVDDGAIRYDLDRHARGAVPSMVSILPPHVVHDGRPATGDGFRKRVLYLETSLLGEQLIGRAVDQPVLPDASLRSAVASLHDALGCVDDLLEADTRLAFVSERIRAALGEPTSRASTQSPRPRRPARAPRPQRPRIDDAERLRDYLDARTFEAVTLTAAAADLGSSVTQLARAFSGTFHIAPHAYVLGRRLDAARDRILAGQPLADVALEVGFSDQAHLTRRFKRFLGTTPGRFGERQGR